MKHLIFFLMVGCMSNPYYSGPQSDHFDGELFFNKDQTPTDKSLWSLIKWKITGDKKAWPDWIEANQKKPAQNIVTKNISITFINHATLLIQVDGINIITDPVWNKRVSPFSWAGPKRVRNPGVKIEDLPQLDFILISHNHYDHLDVETLKILHNKNPQAKILLGLGNGHILKDEGIKNYLELDWEQSFKNEKIEIFFDEAQHWSARGLNDKRQMLWGSFIIKSSQGNIYFAGDTGYGGHFQRIQKRYHSFQVALLPIGSYEPRWFMKGAHMNPDDAVQAHLDLNTQKSVAMHFGTFQLTDEGINEPISDLINALKEKKLSEKEFIRLDFGESQQF